MFELEIVVGVLLEKAFDNSVGVARRREAVVGLLKKLRLNPSELPTDFDGIYVYTLVEYGVGKPRPILELFRQKVVKDAFRKAFELRDHLLFDIGIEDFLSSEDGRTLYQLDYDPRQELALFEAAFYALADHARTVNEVRQYQKLDDIHQVVQQLLKYMENDISADVPQNPRAEDIQGSVTVPKVAVSSFNDDLHSKTSSTSNSDSNIRQLLLIEDDPRIASFVHRGLIYEGFAVDVAFDGEVGIALIEENSYDLVILDVVLPGISGFDVCRRVRSWSDIPIVMLTAQDAMVHRILGFDLGADDYIIKPFHFEELLARIRAVLRRRLHDHKPDEQWLNFADLRLNTHTRQVFRGERELAVTWTEYSLLEYLLRHAGRILTAEEIMDRVWGHDFGDENNIITTYIRHLRHKLEEHGESRLIQTIHGVGYSLRKE